MVSPTPITLSVVVPAFNEERRLAATLTTLCDYLRQRDWDWEVRVVDDGSSDATVAIASSFAANEARVVVQQEPHRGKGAAVRAGLLASAAAYRFACDADLPMPASEIERFLLHGAEPFDVAIGSREGAHARRVGEPVYRHLMGRLFNRVVQLVVLPGIRDSQCGFKMFTARAVESIFPLVTIDGWAFDVEVLAIARAQGLRVLEVPIEWHYREDSRLRMMRDGLEMIRELLRIRGRARRGLYRRAP